MVWIFGGANVFGANSVASYNGASFARDGVIVVSVNLHRLGALGFFAHPALTREAAASPWPYAIMDQIAALKWVQRNIEAFEWRSQERHGGQANPAGGSDILTLLATPAKGLFKRALVESGGGWSTERTLAEAEAQGQTLAAKLRLPADATPAQLRALPVEALIDAQGRYGPITDGRLIRENAAAAFAHGDNIHVPLISAPTATKPH